MDETDRPDDRRAAGSWVLPNGESRRPRNHEAAKSGIPKRKKTTTNPRLSCKIEYLLTSNHRDGSIASEFFTGDALKFFQAASGDRAARRNRPQRFHTGGRRIAAAHADLPVVEIDRRIAMAGDQRQPVAGRGL